MYWLLIHLGRTYSLTILSSLMFLGVYRFSKNTNNFQIYRPLSMHISVSKYFISTKLFFKMYCFWICNFQGHLILRHITPLIFLKCCIQLFINSKFLLNFQVTAWVSFYFLVNSSRKTQFSISQASFLVLSLDSMH